MKFLLDENFPRSVTAFLEKKGHEVIDLGVIGLLGASDAVIAEKAIEAGAVVLTTDRDFFHTFPNVYPTQFGVVVIALRQPNRSLIAQKLEWFLANVSEDQWKDRVFQLRDTTWLTRPPII